MALTLSGTNGIVGAGFTFDPSGASVTVGVGTFANIVSPKFKTTANGADVFGSGASSAYLKLINESATSNASHQFTIDTYNASNGYWNDIKIDASNVHLNTYTGNRVTLSNTALTFATGVNIVMASGNGIDFSAQTPTAVSGASNTAEVLDHYEEGTWTPTNASGQSVDTIANGGAWTISGGAKYTRIGDMVTVYISHWQVPSTGGNYGFAIGGLPFTNMASISVGTNTVVSNSTNAEKGLVVAGTNKIYLYPANTLTQTTNGGLSAKTLYGISATYKVS